MWFLLHIFCCHKLFSLKTFCACDDTFLFPNESEVLRKERFISILISIFIFISYFSVSVSCFEHLSLYQFILWFWKLYFPIWCCWCWGATLFPEIISPRYSPQYCVLKCSRECFTNRWKTNRNTKINIHIFRKKDIVFLTNLD